MTRPQRLTLFAAILGSAVATIDGSIVNVALPSIERDLGGGLPAQQWVSNSYLLALGSPTFPVDGAAWTAWTSTYDTSWRKVFGQEYLSFAPLFGHQYTHVWMDVRNIQESAATEVNTGDPTAVQEIVAFTFRKIQLTDLTTNKTVSFDFAENKI